MDTVSENIWVSSAKEFRKLRVIVLCGMMGALSIVLNFAGSVRIGPFLKIGLSSIPNLVVDFLFGPVVGGIFGGVMDFLKYLTNPDGTFFPGFMVSASVAAVIYGLFLYRRKLTWWRVLIPEILVKALVNCGLNTLWLDLLYGKGFLAILPARVISNLIQLPVDTILIFLVLEAVDRAGRRFLK